MLATAAIAQPSGRGGRPTVVPVAISGSEHLSRFRHAVLDLRRNERRNVRVVHYGDSNVAAGIWTRTTRDRLQRRLGDGGPGWSVPPPWGSMPHPRVTIRGGDRWQSRRHGAGRRHGPADGLWGLAGASVEATGPKTLTIVVHAEATAHVDIHTLGHRRGGSFRIALDDDGRQTEPLEVRTARRRPSPLRTRMVVPAGTHTIKLRVTSTRPVRLLGVDVEEERRGLIYDTLGINGQRAGAIRGWSDDVWGAQLRQRDPDLVILGYGGNEALDVDLTLARYEDQLDGALTAVRRAAPRGSCLVVAPVAMCEHPRNAEVNAIQRRLAAEHDCAFWDTAAVSGGPDSLCGWIGRGLVSADHLHLSEEGYTVVGNVFADALLAEVEPRTVSR